MILHTISKSPLNNSAYSSCIRIAATDDAVLLIEDGVYALLATLPDRAFYALQNDVEARGLSDRVPEQVKLIGYPEFVELTTQASAVQSWY